MGLIRIVSVAILCRKAILNIEIRHDTNFSVTCCTGGHHYDNHQWYHARFRFLVKCFLFWFKFLYGDTNFIEFMRVELTVIDKKKTLLRVNLTEVEQAPR